MSILDLISPSIKFFRAKRKLNQTELARSVDLSLRHFQKIEGKKVDVKSSTIESVAKALDVPPCYLLRGVHQRSLESFGANCIVELLDFLPVGVRVCTTDGKIVYANQKHRELIGVQKLSDENPVYIWDSSADEDEAQKMKNMIRDIKETRPEPTPYFVRHRMPNGDVIPLKVDWKYLTQPNGVISGYLCVSTTHPSW